MAELHQIFTPRRYAIRDMCRSRVSMCVCVRVCVSVIRQYCIKTAKQDHANNAL